MKTRNLTRNLSHAMREALDLTATQFMAGSLGLLVGLASSARAQDGSLDLNWLPRDTAGREIWTDNVGTILVQPDGKILASTHHSFYSVTDMGLEALVGPLLRLNLDGSLDSSFIPSLLLPELPCCTLLNGQSIAIQSDGKIVLTGGAAYQFGRLNLDGTVDFVVRLFLSGQPAQGSTTLALQSDGRILVGGSFDGMATPAGPVIPTGRNIARFNCDGSLDTSFNPGTGVYLNPGIGTAVVKSVVMQLDGKILIGGSFETYNDIESYGITRAYPNGSLDATFSVDWSEVELPSGAVSINVVRLLPNEQILIGGFANVAAGSKAVWLLNPNGSFDTNFSPPLNGELHTILVQPDGKLVIGGLFSTTGEVSRRNIARLNADGTLDNSFDPGEGPLRPVSEIALQPNGGLLIAGYDSLSTVNGVDRPWIARLHTTITAPPQANQPPIANNDSYMLAEDATLVITPPGLLANDNDPDDDVLTISNYGNAGHGSLAVFEDGALVYQPAANYHGLDSFSYTVADTQGHTASAMVNLTITAVNDAPADRDRALSVREDNGGGQLQPTHDVDGDPITYIVVSPPSHGFVNDVGYLEYRPNANYNGPDSFTFKATDGLLESPVYTYTITVLSVNDAPIAAADWYTTDEDTELKFGSPGVLGNDSDPDQGSMTTFTFEGRVLVADADFSAGERFVGFYTFDPAVAGVDHPDPSPSLNRQYDSANGSWEIHFPDSGYRFTGGLISIGVGNDTDFGDRYIATIIGSASIGVPLPSGRQLNFAQLDLQDQVLGSADLLDDESIQTTTVSLALAQIVGGRLNFEGNSNALLTFDQLTGPLSVSQIEGQAASVHQTITLTSGATLRVNRNGSFTYDPRSHFDYLPAGATAGDSFSYQVSDPDGGKATAHVTLTVRGENDAPLLQAIPDTEVVYGQFFQIPHFGTDVDAAINEIALGVSGIPTGVGYRLNRPTGTEFTAEIFGPALQTGAFSVGVTLIDCCVDTHTLFTLIVRRASPTLNLSVADVIYDGQPHPATATAQGVFGEELGPVALTYNGSSEPPIAGGTYTAVASFAGNENYEPVSVEASYTILPRPTIFGLSPYTKTAGSPDFILAVHGDHFSNDAKVEWNGAERPTTFISGTQLTAEISASDVTGRTEIMTVLVTVRNADGGVSNPQSFAITPANVSAAQTTAAEEGQTSSVSTAPNVAGESGVAAEVNNTGGEPVSMTVANYSSNPSGAAFSAGGGFTDVQITGADPADTATVRFYYPSTIDPATEVPLTLFYFNDTAWSPVRGSGNSDPQTSTTDNLDGTISGGRFTVLFDNTSTPNITDLNGTFFAVGTAGGIALTGFLPPLGGADTTGGTSANPLRTFKMGSTIPVRFTATLSGAPVLTGKHKLQAIKFSAATTADTPIDATPQDGATLGNEFRLTDGQWHFNLDTKATGMTVGVWQLIATLSDGSTHSVWVQLK